MPDAWRQLKVAEEHEVVCFLGGGETSDDELSSWLQPVEEDASSEISQWLRPSRGHAGPQTANSGRSGGSGAGTELRVSVSKGSAGKGFQDSGGSQASAPSGRRAGPLGFDSPGGLGAGSQPQVCAPKAFLQARVPRTARRSKPQLVVDAFPALMAPIAQAAYSLQCLLLRAPRGAAAPRTVRRRRPQFLADAVPSI